MRAYLADAASALQRRFGLPFGKEDGGMVLLDAESLGHFIYASAFEPGSERGTAAIRFVTGGLREGRIPALSELLDAFPIEAESDEARQLLTRFTYFLNLAGCQGQLRAEQLNLSLSIRGRESVVRQLMTFIDDFEAGSDDAQRIQAEVQAIRYVVNDLASLLQDSLSRDPSRGHAVEPKLPWKVRLRKFLSVLKPGFSFG